MPYRDKVFFTNSARRPSRPIKIRSPRPRGGRALFMRPRHSTAFLRRALINGDEFSATFRNIVADCVEIPLTIWARWRSPCFKAGRGFVVEICKARASTCRRTAISKECGPLQQV